MSEVDHLIEAAAEKIVDWAHRVISKNSQKMTLGISKYGSYYTRRDQYLQIKSIGYESVRCDEWITDYPARSWHYQDTLGSEPLAPLV